ncbi:hypothetical protein [Thaumasiovibrio subtropicus]|uniref:hypothetical protein n=1 Tax=Thaumasiovibrio subtropicus TaxID=1891207 RepID=UPI000B351A0E|nr:hypothetical protein [Thaumasiovibrio subtropicus]
MSRPVYIYVDVDETFVRNYGSKRIPVPGVIRHIKDLFEQGALMYCWSSGGAEYAQSSAREFDIEDCFVGFLPKPVIVIDDMQFSSWRNLLEVHPNECSGESIESYREKIIENQTKT